MKLINDVSLHNQNQLHGFLLMVQVILNTQSSDKLFDELPSGKLLGLLLGKHYIGLKFNMCPITRGLYLSCVTELIKLIIDWDSSHIDQLLILINEAQDYLINNGDEEPLNSELPSVMFSFLKAVSVSLPNANINLLDVAMFTWQKSPHFVIIYDYLYRSIVVDAVTSHDTELQLALSAISHIRNDDSQYTYMLLTALAIKWKENEQQVDWMALFQFAITKLGTQSIRYSFMLLVLC
jgi:hypothetical protein